MLSGSCTVVRRSTKAWPIFFLRGCCAHGRGTRRPLRLNARVGQNRGERARTRGDESVVRFDAAQRSESRWGLATEVRAINPRHEAQRLTRGPYHGNLAL